MADLERIKRNVAKMAGMGAPEADIDGYIASEGVTVDDVRNFKMGAPVAAADKFSDLPYPGNPNFTPQQPGSGPGLADYASQAASGMNEGLGYLAGAPVDLTTAAMNLGISGVNAAFPDANIKPIDKPAFGSQALVEALTGAGTIAPESEDPSLRFTRRVGQDVGASAIPIMGTAGRAARPLSMIAKELALSAGSGVGAGVAQEFAPGNSLAELAGQLIGSGGIAGLTKAGRKLVTPFSTSPERRAAADLMQAEGVDLTAGQRTGDKGLKYAESELGGQRIGDINEQQAKQFTSAALRRAGVSADVATPEVMDAAFTNLGRQFDDLASRSQMPLDQQLGQQLGSAVADYRALVPESQRAPVVENVVADLINAAGGSNVVPGPVYQALRSRLDRLARSAKSDPQLSDALFSIRNALDDSVERYLAQADPDMVAAWRQARSDYRGMLTLEKAAQGAGENAALGIISPAALRSATQSVYGKRSYVRGTDPFSELAQAGQATMTPMPQSGTASRMAVRTLGTGIPAAVGAVLGEKAMPGLGSLIGAAGGVALPKLAGAAMLSNPGRAYLANQLLNDMPSGSNGIGPLSAAITGQTGGKKLTPRDQALIELLATP